MRSVNLAGSMRSALLGGFRTLLVSARRRLGCVAPGRWGEPARHSFTLLLTALLVIPVAACDSASDGAVVTSQTATGVAEPGPNAASGQVEVDALLWLREEEKLARDIYLALAERWGTGIFESIAASEQKHMDAVAGLLHLYGLEDPVGSNGPGVFTDANLQKLYDELLERGSASVSEALLVGATIEDLDIHDLRNAIAASSAAEVGRVLGNLERASLNHLRAFAAQLERNGVAYTPEYLDAAEFQSIVAAGPRHGNGNRGSRRGLSG